MSTERNSAAQELSEQNPLLELQKYREELFLKFASGNPSMFFAEIFDLLKVKQREVLGQLSKQPLEDLNIRTWHQQIKKAREQGLGEQHIKNLLHTDLKFFTKEYILHQNHDQFPVDIIEEKQSTTWQYLQSNFQEMAQNMLQYKGRKKSRSDLPTRPEIEAVLFGDFLSAWLVQSRPGEKLALISPPGKKSDGYLGYDGYSFLYVYETNIQAGKKKALVHTYRLWLNPQESASLLQKLAKKSSQPNLLQRALQNSNFQNRELINHLIMLSATGIDSQLNTTEIEKLLLPLEQKTPQDQKEINIDRKAFWQDFDQLFTNFFWANSKTIFAKKTLEAQDVQELDRLRRFWENAVKNNQLFYRTVKNSPETNTRITSEKLNQEYQAFLTYWKKEKTATPGEAHAFNLGLAALFQNVGGLSALQRGLSLGSCLGGTLPSLMIQSNTTANNFGLSFASTQEIAAKGYHCPLCHQSIADPCFCPKCSPTLLPKPFLGSQEKTSSLQPRLDFSRRQTKFVTRQNPYESESLADFFAKLIGPQTSTSFGTWVAKS